MFGHGCDAEVAAMLACLPTHLSKYCEIQYPFDTLECMKEVDEYKWCMEPDLSSCGALGATTVGNSCQGHAEGCSFGDLGISCNGNGDCTCTLNGVVVGTCGNLVAGMELCTVHASCCRPFFGFP